MKRRGRTTQAALVASVNATSRKFCESSTTSTRAAKEARESQHVLLWHHVLSWKWTITFKEVASICMEVNLTSMEGNVTSMGLVATSTEIEATSAGATFYLHASIQVEATQTCPVSSVGDLYAGISTAGFVFIGNGEENFTKHDISYSVQHQTFNIKPPHNYTLDNKKSTTKPSKNGKVPVDGCQVAKGAANPLHISLAPPRTQVD